MISQAVSEYYTNCPVCNHRTGSLFECSEKHPAEKFRNNEKEFLLTGIVNERDEIVAGAVAIRNEGSSYSSYRVEILAKTDTGYNRLNYLDENV
ncbi:MAG TPA: hypothetical protein P5052_01645 [Candidatus Paceibacterota bacterium]|nr:hypothetical protein [Candidatus Paceibacterota bacterium]HRZ29466.1 hypothetical protein [Candidatus Paceibacterota bacterium]